MSIRIKKNEYDTEYASNSLIISSDAEEKGNFSTLDWQVRENDTLEVCTNDSLDFPGIYMHRIVVNVHEKCIERQIVERRK